MATTFSDSKSELMRRAGEGLAANVADSQLTTRQKLALTCRALFDAGHDSGLAGQITARAEADATYYTQRLGLGFDEITEDNLLLVDEDLNVLDGDGPGAGSIERGPTYSASCTPMPSTWRRCRCWRFR
jgi:L-fuculose-phosphate aldolase